MRGFVQLGDNNMVVGFETIDRSIIFLKIVLVNERLIDTISQL
jgi:hypothetical protein